MWQPDANQIYSGMMPEDVAPLEMPNNSSGIPRFNLRGRVITDGDGRYEFRTVVPGIERLGLQEDSPLTALV